jgi:hypothetical protein
MVPSFVYIEHLFLAAEGDIKQILTHTHLFVRPVRDFAFGCLLLLLLQVTPCQSVGNKIKK